MFSWYSSDDNDSIYVARLEVTSTERQSFNMMKHSINRSASINTNVLTSLNYITTATITFQRLSVMATDVVLLLAVLMFSRTWPSVTTTELGYSSGKLIVASVVAYLQ